jgi:hypothetical protein
MNGAVVQLAGKSGGVERPAKRREISPDRDPGIAGSKVDRKERGLITP